jgi:SAM-dependent methyltransferase
MKMYNELASWWPLLSAPEDYDEEARIFAETIEAHARRDVHEVLELGCGGGNNAVHLKGRWQMTLTDLSAGMLEHSRILNPECEHIQADMRALRLERDFDAVFVHDAVCYMTTEEDLRAAMQTAFVHTRPGGVALLVPDDTLESYVPSTDWHGKDGDGRSLRTLEWHHPHEPSTTICRVSYVILTREDDGEVQHVYDEHITGLFPRATWLRLLEEVGFEVQAIPYEHSTFDPRAGRAMFLGARPTD